MSRTSTSKLKATAVMASALMISLAGCASGATPQADPENQKLIFVTYQGGEAGEKYVQVVDAFEEANPGVEVEIQVLTGDDTYNGVVTSRIQGGTSPDLFETLNGYAGLEPYVSAEMIEDLSDQPWVSDQIAAAKEFAELFDDKTVQFSAQVDGSGVFYNEDLFEQYDVEVPTNWDEFLDVVDIFRAAGVTPLAVGAKDGWPFLQQVGQMAAQYPELSRGGADFDGLLSGELPFSETAWADIIDEYAGLIAMGAYDPNASGITFNSSVDDFANGRAAMFINGTFAVSAIRGANPDLPVASFPLPYTDDQKDLKLLVGLGANLVIPTTAPNGELAKKFLAFLAEPEILSAYLTTASAFSPLVGVSGEIDPAAEGLAPYVEENSINNTASAALAPAARAALLAGMQSMIAGSATAGDVLAQVDLAQKQ
ncbi:MAG: extracellular solute-binding protein [Mycetocola sp.]